MSKRKEAMKLHKHLLRDDPKYRAEWESIKSLFLTMLADVELRKEPIQRDSTADPVSPIEVSNLTQDAERGGGT